MADRKKPLSTTSDDSPGRRTKRPRLREAKDSGISQQPPSSRSATTLPELLDFTYVSSKADIHNRFGQIARALLHDHLLVLTTQLTTSDPRNSEYEFLEVEFYLRKGGIHEDPFTHGTSEQSSSGKWYFHRAPQKSSDPTKSATSASGYRGGTRKGLDLTMGGPVVSSHFAQAVQVGSPRGGILLRSLRRISDGVVISGPSLLVDEVLRVCGAASLTELVNELLASDTSAFPSKTSLFSKKCSISIKPRTSAQGRKPIVYSSPRIGLDLSHPGTTSNSTDPRIVFIQKLYRYFTNPTLLTANGRPQTFLGIYNLLSEAEILNEGGVLDEVARLTGLKRTSVEKYVSDFKQGKERGKLSTFIGSAGKGSSSSPTTYLRMMGVLSRLDLGPRVSET